MKTFVLVIVIALGVAMGIHLFVHYVFKEGGILDQTCYQRLGLKLSGGGRLSIDEAGKISIIDPEKKQAKVDVKTLAAKETQVDHLVLKKDGKPLWRMFQKEDGIYLENLNTGKSSKILTEPELIEEVGGLLQKATARLSSAQDTLEQCQTQLKVCLGQKQ